MFTARTSGHVNDACAVCRGRKHCASGVCFCLETLFTSVFSVVPVFEVELLFLNKGPTRHFGSKLILCIF